MGMHYGRFGNMQKEFAKIFKGKTVLVTGHTGFIGTWMSLWLSLLGSKVIGFSDSIPTNPSMFETIHVQNDIHHIIGDVNNISQIRSIIKKRKPDIIIHLAAQSLVRESYSDPSKTFQTNVIGTLNVLESIRNSSVKSCIIMTSDKCYLNKNSGQAFIENDPLGGNDPYSASKGAAELVTHAYRNSFFKQNNVGIATIRAGNVFGGGDWAKDRLIPDCIRSLILGKKIMIRNPNSVRPWQFVLEPISGIFYLLEKLNKNPNQFSEAWNFGPNISSKKLRVGELVTNVINEWGEGKWMKDSKSNKYHEANSLMLNSSKAKRLLNWKPIYTINESTAETVEWYHKYRENKEDMKEFTIKQIMRYVTKAENMNNRTN